MPRDDVSAMVIDLGALWYPLEEAETEAENGWWGSSSIIAWAHRNLLICQEDL